MTEVYITREGWRRLVEESLARRKQGLEAARQWLKRTAHSTNFHDATQALRVMQALNSDGLVPLHPTARTWLERHAGETRWPVVRRWAALLLEEIAKQAAD